MRKIFSKFKTFGVRNKFRIILYMLIIIIIIFSGSSYLMARKYLISQTQKNELSHNLIKTQKDLDNLKNQDQYKINQDLKSKIKNSDDTYNKSILLYQKIQDLKDQKQDTSDFDKAFAQVLNDLSKLNYTSASANLKTLSSSIDKKYASIAVPSSAQSTANIAKSNTPPGSGSSTQAVTTDNGVFRVSIIAADMNSTRVIVDTASDSDCHDNCPVLSLGDYAARSGAFAGINGNFFCPASYPSCVGKTNSFDTLVMNKNKHYFNSDNNIYSTVPAVIFSGNSARFVGASQEWGRDTSVDGVIANYPLYIAGGNNQFGGSSDPKINDKGTRTFVATKGSMVYIGIVYSASAADAAKVLKTMGMDNALGLDQGGSTALWSGGSYLAGPGRAIPNAILFVRK